MKLAYDAYTPPPGEYKSDLAPVLLMHSILETKETWKPIAPAIARNTGRKVYAIDSRHHGESEWKGEYCTEAMAEDLEEFLNEHKIPQVILLGHSLGGKIAMIFAIKQPKKVEKLIIEDSAVTKITVKAGNMVSEILTMGKEGIEGLILAAVDEKSAKEGSYEVLRTFAPLLRVAAESVEKYPFEYLPVKWNGEKLVVCGNLDALIEAIQNDKLQTNDLVGSYYGDTMFLFGYLSQFKAHKDKSIEKHFPQAVKVVFKKGGHFIHQVFPDEFVSTVSDFINYSHTKLSKY